MKIVKLAVENILKLKAICIIPKSEVIEIKGKNEAGKSSILDAIIMGFKGKKEFPAMPIRKGAKKGKIVISLDGDAEAGIGPFTITETITEKSTSLIIEPDSVLLGETPRSFLDKLIGKISFDPMAFINQEGAKQRRVLLDMIGIDVDALDAKEKRIFDERTVKGRELKTQQVKTDTAFKLYSSTEVRTEEIKMSELSEQLTSAINHNNSIINRKAANNNLRADAIKIRDIDIPASQLKISEWEELIRKEKINLLALNTSLDTKRSQHKIEKEKLDQMVEINIDDINSQISDIENTNTQIRNNNNYLSEKKSYDTIKEEYDILEGKIENVRAERISLLQSTKMPVDGLSFDEEGLLYNDIPFKQCSSGAKLMVSMGISMALNPTIRVLRITDGSLLDSENLAILKKMAKDDGYQIFIESVSSQDQYNNNGKIGIFIEEGSAIFEDGVPISAIGEGKVNKKTDKIDDESW